MRSTERGDVADDVYVARSTGSHFLVGTRWNDDFCINDDVCVVGDFNGDGKDDIAAFVRDTQSSAGRAGVFVALSDGTQFGTPQLWQNTLCQHEQETCAIGDADGDGRDDAIVFVRDGQMEPVANDVLVARSTDADSVSSRIFLPLVQR